MNKKRLGDLLMSLGFITEEQMNKYLEMQADSGMRLGELVVADKLIAYDQLAAVLEVLNNVPVVSLSTIKLASETVKLISESMARRHCVIPIKLDGNVLTLAMADPFDFMAQDDIRMATGKSIEVVMAEEADIRKLIDMNFDASEAVQQTFQEMSELAEKPVEIDLREDEVNNSPVVRLVTTIINRAVKMRASDIHIEAYEKILKVRYRVDGELHEVMSPPKQSHPAIIARIKIIGGMDIAEKRIPQDGHASVVVDNKAIDLRISVLPTIHGEKVVMRILDRSSIMVTKEKIGFTPHNAAVFDKIIKVTEGIILLTGPTGSGKTTTLYATLQEVSRPNVNIITAEDPVEYHLEGINQVQINEKAGMTFASALRSMLRQDPDIIMVGEMRDGETASIAIRAAITGHLVLSTLHTNDTAGSISRLIDMGVEPYMVATAVAGIVAQRLVRRICPQCREKVEMEPALRKTLGLEAVQIYHGKGCNNCSNTGYVGRIAIHEILALDRDLKMMITRGDPIAEIKQEAIKKGMLTLQQSCVELIKAGITTPDELIRVTYSID